MLIYIVVFAIVTTSQVAHASSFDKHFPSSCQDPSIIEDGEYYIYPDGLSPVLVYCDVTKGGWATIFNKVEKGDYFHRTTTDYVYGIFLIFIFLITPKIGKKINFFFNIWILVMALDRQRRTTGLVCLTFAIWCSPSPWYYASSYRIVRATNSSSSTSRSSSTRPSISTCSKWATRPLVIWSTRSRTCQMPSSMPMTRISITRPPNLEV